MFDAHDKAFLFYGGVCRRGIYDNMKTAVEAIFVGKARQYNRRFLQMCSHHLIEPVACTPAAGWEKGQVENQVGNLRDRLFRPKPRVKSLVEQLDALKTAISEDKEKGEDSGFGDRTSAWLGNALTYVGKKGGQIVGDVAKATLTKAVLAYFGLE